MPFEDIEYLSVILYVTVFPSGGCAFAVAYKTAERATRITSSRKFIWETRSADRPVGVARQAPLVQR